MKDDRPLRIVICPERLRRLELGQVTVCKLEVEFCLRSAAGSSISRAACLLVRVLPEVVRRGAEEDGIAVQTSVLPLSISKTPFGFI